MTSEEFVAIARLLSPSELSQLERNEIAVDVRSVVAEELIRRVRALRIPEMEAPGYAQTC